MESGSELSRNALQTRQLALPVGTPLSELLLVDGLLSVLVAGAAVLESLVAAAFVFDSVEVFEVVLLFDV